MVYNLKNNKVQSKLSLLFFALMSAYATSRLLFMYEEDKTVIDIVGAVLLSASAFSCLAVFFYGNFSKRERASLILSLLVATAVFAMLGYQGAELFVLASSMLMIKNVNLRNVARVICCSMLVVLSLYLITALIGVLPTVFDSKLDSFNGNQIDFMRIGGVHGNVIFIIVFAIWSAFLYGFRVTKLRIILGEIAIIICYCIFRSRTGLILCSLEAVYFFINCIPSVKRIVLIIRKNSFVVWAERYLIIALAFSPIIMSLFFYETALFSTLNTIFTSRFECTHSYIEAYGISLIPREVKLFTPLDNLYSYVFVNYGLIVYCAMLVVIIKCTSKLSKGRKYDEIFLVNVFGLYGMSERIIFKPACFIPILLFAILFYKNYRIPEKNKDLGTEKRKDEEKQ